MQKVQLAVRLLALAILIAGFVSVGMALQPRSAEYVDFARAVDAGDVDLILLSGNGGPSSSDETVWVELWSTGAFQWRRGPVSETPVTAGEFTRSLREHNIAVERDDGNSMATEWLFRIPTWFGTLLALTWVATFVAMISSRPRWGNRWAWFWVFVIGQIGVLIYLLIEPTPLWTRTPKVGGASTDSRDVAAASSVVDTRVTGGRGCLYAILASLGAAAFAGAVGWVVNSILS